MSLDLEAQAGQQIVAALREDGDGLPPSIVPVPPTTGSYPQLLSCQESFVPDAGQLRLDGWHTVPERSE